MIGKGDLNLIHDQPPDLVVEIDRTKSSLDKFSIYAALGVPEIWRVAGDLIECHLLFENEYVESATSAAFPFLTNQKPSEFLAVGFAEGERKAASAVRSWLRETSGGS